MPAHGAPPQVPRPGSRGLLLRKEEDPGLRADGPGFASRLCMQERLCFLGAPGPLLFSGHKVYGTGVLPTLTSGPPGSRDPVLPGRGPQSLPTIDKQGCLEAPSETAPEVAPGPRGTP